MFPMNSQRNKIFFSTFTEIGLEITPNTTNLKSDCSFLSGLKFLAFYQ